MIPNKLSIAIEYFLKHVSESDFIHTTGFINIYAHQNEVKNYEETNSTKKPIVTSGTQISVKRWNKKKQRKHNDRSPRSDYKLKRFHRWCR